MGCFIVDAVMPSSLWEGAMHFTDIEFSKTAYKMLENETDRLTQC